MVPCAAILVFYFLIFLFSFKSKARTKSATLSNSLRIAKGLFASFMLFFVCWMPYALIVLTDYSDKLPRQAVMFTMSIAHLNSSLNLILYAIFNPAFKRGYRVLFRRIFLLYWGKIELKAKMICTRLFILCTILRNLILEYFISF